MISTVLGGSGFIGSHLVRALKQKGEPFWMPGRDDNELFNRPLGAVYYCIGLTADFRERPYDTVHAHVCLLKEILEKANFTQLIYLSTTRMYAKNLIAEENQPISVESFKADDLYNLSKLMGESLVLSSKRTCRVARLSNVLGEQMGTDNFIGMLLEEANKNKSIHFQTSLESEKDYIWINDVVDALLLIAEKGRAPIYNIASGINLKHKVVAEMFKNAGLKISVAPNSPKISFPPISINKMVNDLGFKPELVEYKLSELINTTKV